MLLKIFLLSASLALSGGSSLPSWHDLNCEEGQKNLFSDVTHNWYDAMGECELYGGWLLSINSQREQNCLVRYANSAGIESGWFWHDGKI